MNGHPLPHPMAIVTPRTPEDPAQPPPHDPKLFADGSVRNGWVVRDGAWVKLK